MFENINLIEQGNTAGITSLALITLVLAVCLTIVYISHKKEKSILNDALKKEQAAKEEPAVDHRDLGWEKQRRISGGFRNLPSGG